MSKPSSEYAMAPTTYFALMTCSIEAILPFYLWYTFGP
jgi:hypothetical protein